MILVLPFLSIFFFFNDTATTEIYTLSLHDALPISALAQQRPVQLVTGFGVHLVDAPRAQRLEHGGQVNFPALVDRKSTRLNSSHSQISYAVFCLKKKKNT